MLGKWGIRNDNAPRVGGTENRVGCGIEKTDGAVYGVDRELNAGSAKSVWNALREGWKRG